MSKKKQNAPLASQSIVYYAGRVLQRVALLLAVASTVVLWITMVSIAHDHASLSMHEIDQNLYTEISDVNTNLIESYTSFAVLLSLIAAAITVLFLQIPRVRKYEKRLVVDGVVIAAFCFFAAVMSQSLFSRILAYIYV